ncbi:MAG: imidazolonepropionase [Deltaproteobacteria bacterium]|nr:MAG: imidazolonepropionase [Deltaproteobacteria bacterium]
MDLAIRGIQTLLTMDEDGGLGRVNAAAIAFSDGCVAWVGPDAEAPDAAQIVDGSGLIGLPGLVDCHTHAAWAGSRAPEFEQRLAGADYSAILEAGGGILSTVRATREASEDALVAHTTARLLAMRDRGVTTVEVKSGYGLSPEHETKQLRAARRAGDAAGMRVIPTWLGAHTVPAEHRADRARYLAQLVDEQLPAVAGLARFADAYVDRGAFTVDEARTLFTAAKAAGLSLRIHAEQVVHTGAAALAAELGAASADHLERIDDAGIAAMAKAGTVGVLLPGAMLYLRDPAPPVADLRAAGVRMAVATDYNPGTSPVIDLWTAATLATVTMRLTVTEALRGITVEAARALELDDVGVIRPGAAGDVVLVRPPAGEPCEPSVLVQHLGAHRAAHLVIGGRLVH